MSTPIKRLPLEHIHVDTLRAPQNTPKAPRHVRTDSATSKAVIEMLKDQNEREAQSKWCAGKCTIL